MTALVIAEALDPVLGEVVEQVAQLQHALADAVVGDAGYAHTEAVIGYAGSRIVVIHRFDQDAPLGGFPGHELYIQVAGSTHPERRASLGRRHHHMVQQVIVQCPTQGYPALAEGFMQVHEKSVVMTQG